MAKRRKRYKGPRGRSPRNGFFQVSPTGRTLRYSNKKRIYLRDAYGRFKPKYGHSPKGTRVAMALDASGRRERQSGVIIYRPDRVKVIRSASQYSR